MSNHSAALCRRLPASPPLTVPLTSEAALQTSTTGPSLLCHGQNPLNPGAETLGLKPSRKTWGGLLQLRLINSFECFNVFAFWRGEQREIGMEGAGRGRTTTARRRRRKRKRGGNPGTGTSESDLELSPCKNVLTRV